MPKQQQYLFLEKKYKPLTLCFDNNAQLISWYGDLTHFGFTDEIDEMDAIELFPLLVGMNMEKSNEIPYVNLANGQSADIHIQPNESGFSISLVDSTEQRAGHEKVQQVANEVSLLNTRLERLTAELEEKNTELNKANQAKSEFIAGMSHEFRTPIVSILGHSAWLIKQVSEKDQSIKNIETIERSAKFLLALIDNLLRQGQISAKQLRIAKGPANINSFIKSILQIIQPLADEKNLSLRCSLLAGECNCFLIDKHYLQQVLINLLANAVKFTREGEVCLSIEANNQLLNIEVKDTGIGIPSDSLKDILIPFTRAKNARSFQGAGLGLSIANEIIINMGGDLEIFSEVNKGTSIRMSIPAEHTACIKTESNPSISATINSGPVLLMEDNHDIVSIYELFFNEAGVDLTSVTDSSQFFEVVQSIQPSMIIIDYHLGETTGIDLVRTVRRSGFKGKIIMLTATSDIDEALQHEALAAGCDRFMAKPEDIKSLVNFVKSEID